MNANSIPDNSIALACTYTQAEVRDMLAGLHRQAQAFGLELVNRIPSGELCLRPINAEAASLQPAGDAAMPVSDLLERVIARSVKEASMVGEHAHYDQTDRMKSELLAALAAKDAEIGLTRFERDTEKSLREQADARIAGLEADLAEERARIASMRTEWGAEVAALTAQARHAEAEAAKSERRAIAFGDALHRNILAMRAAFVAWRRGKARDGMVWISNTLGGPGHIPTDADIALGAQELFDKEVAEHEAFRASNPGPVAPAADPALRDTAAMLAEHRHLVSDLESAARDWQRSERGAGWQRVSARLKSARLAVEASAKRMLELA